VKVPRKPKRTPREQAEAYLAKCAPAISGQDGNGTTARLAKAVVLGFDLDPHTALSAFRQWNESCTPPWPEKDLLRLLEAAAKWPGERGNLLAKDGQEPFTPPPAPAAKPAPPPVERKPPARDGFRAPTVAELHAILFHRELGGLAGLSWAAERGVLVVGQWRDWQCYGVTDASGRVLEVRRVDNEMFPEMGPLPPRKSHSIKGSEKQWPLGIQEAIDFPAIALVEGVPDFLVAHDLILWEQAGFLAAGGSPRGTESPAREPGPTCVGVRADLSTVRCAPVAMLSASPAICADALPFFKGKRVIIFAHAEAAGLAGAEKWRRQLQDVGVATCNLFDFSAWLDQSGQHPNDLDEFIVQRANFKPKNPPADWTQQFKVMPC
jgi:hypothetical protein